MSNPFFQNEAPKKKNSIFLKFLELLVVLSSISVVLYLFVLTPNQVDGPSMDPTFADNQIVLTSKLPQWFGKSSIGNSLNIDYKRGDVIVFQEPGEPKALIKRVIGVPGDRVSIRDGFFYVNGSKLIENYLEPSVFTRGGSAIQEGGEGITVLPDTYFVAGDNRPVSKDSRVLGLIKREWFKGKVIFRFWPSSDLAIISRGKWELE